MEKIVKQTIEAEYEGDIWLAEWASFIMHDGSESYDRWLNVSRKEANGGLTDIEDIHEEDTDHYECIVQLLAAERVKEIQAEYGLPSEEIDEVSISEQILTRVWSGEWMGQLRNSYYFFGDNLAKILGKDSSFEIFETIDTLRAQKKVGLNGFILVPWEEEDNAFKSWEKSTGHKKLTVSDMGGWRCEACGNFAYQEGPWAAKVPCEEQQSAIEDTGEESS